jgi:hypothetical protein
VASATKANGKTTSYTYSWGRLQHTQTPEYTITRVIDPDGTMRSETIAGRTTTYSFDSVGRLEQVQGPGGTLIETEYFWRRAASSSS